MGKRTDWLSAVKKVLIPESKEKKDKDAHKWKRKWFGKHRSPGLDSSPLETAFGIPVPPAIEEVKLGEAENEQSKHACSVALATAVADEVAVVAVQAAAEAVRRTPSTCYSGKSEEEVAVIKIQTAFRGYLARRALQALRGLVRLKSLIQGQSVKCQATTTLQCMQTLARVQLQIRSRRIKLSEESKASHKQLLRKCDKAFEKLRASIGEDWDDRLQSKEQIEADLQSKQEAAVRRERALAYAYSHQQMQKNSSKSSNCQSVDSNNPHWGWSWLERWMAARPWENRSTFDKEVNSDLASIKSTTSRAISVGEISKSYVRHVLNVDNKRSPTAEKSSHQSASVVAKKARQPSPKGSGSGADDDSRSMLSFHSARYRQHSIAESSVRDDESFLSSPSVPSYMASTESAKAKSRLPSPLGSDTNGISKNGSATSAKKRISFPSPPAMARSQTGSPKVVSNSSKDIGGMSQTSSHADANPSPRRRTHGSCVV